MNPTARLYIIRGLTDVAKSGTENPDYLPASGPFTHRDTINIFSFAFKLMALDKNLPDDIGLELVRELRDEQLLLAVLPVSLEGDIGKYLDGFFDHFMDL